MTSPIKQFKLTNDDELICEVLDWNDEEGVVIIRGAFKLIEAEDMDRGIRFWAFRPWMGFNEDPETLQTLTSGHIIGEMTPADSLIEHYNKTVERVKQFGKKKKDVQFAELSGMTEEEIDDYLDSVEEEFEISFEADFDLDDEGDGAEKSNVVQLKPPTNTKH